MWPWNHICDPLTFQPLCFSLPTIHHHPLLLPHGVYLFRGFNSNISMYIYSQHCKFGNNDYFVFNVFFTRVDCIFSCRNWSQSLTRWKGMHLVRPRDSLRFHGVSCLIESSKLQTGTNPNTIHKKLFFLYFWVFVNWGLKYK